LQGIVENDSIKHKKRMNLKTIEAINFSLLKRGAGYFFEEIDEWGNTSKISKS